MSGFDINHIVLTGGLTRDPELRNLPSGTSVCSLRIANNTRQKNRSSGEWEDRANYFDVTIWGGLGEYHARTLHKGSQVVVAGRIEWREYESNGVKRQAYDITADSVIPRDGKDGGGGGSSEPQVPVDDDFRQAPAAAPSGGGGGPDDDIPF